MLSKIPANLERVKKEDIDKEILRVGIIAELDAINLYEQLASLATDENIKKVLIDIANEEKTHMGEFQELLLRKDEVQAEELKKGKMHLLFFSGYQDNLSQNPLAQFGILGKFGTHTYRRYDMTPRTKL